MAPNSLSKLTRYEAGIQHGIERSIRLLKAYQAASQSRQTEPETCPQPPGDDSADSPVEPGEPAEAPGTPADSANYHSNPKNGGIAPDPDSLPSQP